MNGNNNENKLRNKKIKTEIIKRSQLIEKKGDLDIYLYPKIELREEEKLNESKVLLFCGQSGVGKTTFINAFLNIILGVSYDDKFRFKLIVEKETENGQTESQTSEINFYYIEKTEIYPSFVIIDTPGIGDTKGKERDKEIIGKFEKTFKDNKILKIHCICFLLKNDDNRAHEFINYMMKSYTELFGKDIISNFVTLITHWDGIEQPDSINLVQKDPVYKIIIEEIKKNSKKEEVNWYYLINSKLILTLPKDNNKVNWNITRNNIEKFIDEKVLVLKKKDIFQTIEVIEKRKKYDEEYIKAERKLQDLINSTDSLKQTKEQYEKTKNKLVELNKALAEYQNSSGEKKRELEKKINELQRLLNKTITFKKTIYYNELIGYSWKYFSSLICNECKINCHEYCDCLGGVWIGRWGCGRIKNDYCTYCKCHYENHSRGDYHYVERSTIIEETIDYLNSNEKSSKSKEVGQNEEKLKQLKSDRESKLKNLSDEIEKKRNELKYYENKINNLEKEIKEKKNDALFSLCIMKICVNKIMKIALNTESIESLGNIYSRN